MLTAKEAKERSDEYFQIRFSNVKTEIQDKIINATQRGEYFIVEENTIFDRMIFERLKVELVELGYEVDFCWESGGSFMSNAKLKSCTISWGNNDKCGF